MKLLQIRKILSVALVVCIISGNSVNVSAAEHTGPEEIIDQTESLSEEEESTGPSSEETAEKSEDPEDGTGDLPASGEDTSVSEEGNDAASDVKPLPSESETVTDAGIEDEQEALPTDENASSEEDAASGEGSLDEEIVPDNKEQTDTIEPDVSEEGSILEEAEETSIMPMSSNENGTYTTERSSGNFANVVVFVDFQDTDHTTHDGCFMNFDRTGELFDGSQECPRGLSEYLSHISYGKLKVDNIFPQYDENQGKIIPYTLSGSADSYDADSTGTDNQIIGEVLKELEANERIASMNLDRNGDGCVDNLTIVLASGKDIGDKFYGRKGVYGGGNLNGCKVADYVRLSEYDAYGIPTSYGVVIHEFLHVLGYPDLYTSSKVPVGLWDVMASVNSGVQYPLAYLRSEYTNWFDIPVVTQTSGSYSLYAASRATAATKDQQALILKTPYSDTEFFVVEFRKKSTDKNSRDYDYSVPGSGLIVYRVNTASQTNQGDLPMIYVFRPGDNYDANGYEAGMGDIFDSYLSLESGRTSYGSGDRTKSLSDGAITYADGTNSGIVISNVGSAEADTISFNITYENVFGDDFWTSVSSQKVSDLRELDSCMDTDGTVYFLMKKNAPDNQLYLYKYSSAGWEMPGNPMSGSGFDYHLARYAGSMYVAYNTGSNIRLLKWNERENWKTIYTSPTASNGITITADSEGVYLAYISSDNSKLYAYKYTTSGGTDLGIVAENAAYISSPVISAENGQIAVAYREFRADDRWSVYKYDGRWKPAGSLSVRATGATMKIHKGNIYFLSNCEKGNGNAGYLYLYPLSASDGKWTQVKQDSYMDKGASSLDLCFHGDAPHVIYQAGDSKQVYVSTLSNGKWNTLSGRVTGESVSSLKGYSLNGNIYLIYRDNGSDYVYIKSHVSENTEKIPEAGNESTDKPSGGNAGGTGGSTEKPSGGNTGGTGGSTEKPSGGNTGGGLNNKNGLQYDSKTGNWYVYKNGKIDYQYTGVTNNENGWWYVRNGKLDWNYTGVAPNEHGWWYIRNGALDWNYTGVAPNEHGWWYIRNGALDWNYTGVAPNEHGWWYIRNGQLDWNYTGVAPNEHGWWYIKNGALDWSYTGVAPNENGWWYIRNGALDWSYTGVAPNEHGWWYIRNGQLDWNYTGVAPNEHGWWYIRNGALDWGYTGVGINENGWWYIRNGALDWNYSGPVVYYGRWYWVINGCVLH